MDENPIINIIDEKLKNENLKFGLKEINLKTVEALFQTFEDSHYSKIIMDNESVQVDIIYPLVKEIFKNQPLRNSYLGKLEVKLNEGTKLPEIYHFIIFLRNTNESEVNNILGDDKEVFLRNYLLLTDIFLLDRQFEKIVNILSKNLGSSMSRLLKEKIIQAVKVDNYYDLHDILDFDFRYKLISKNDFIYLFTNQDLNLFEYTLLNAKEMDFFNYSTPMYFDCFKDIYPDIATYINKKIVEIIQRKEKKYIEFLFNLDLHKYLTKNDFISLSEDVFFNYLDIFYEFGWGNDFYDERDSLYETIGDSLSHLFKKYSYNLILKSYQVKNDDVIRLYYDSLLDHLNEQDFFELINKLGSEILEYIIRKTQEKASFGYYGFSEKVNNYFFEHVLKVVSPSEAQALQDLKNIVNEEVIIADDLQFEGPKFAIKLKEKHITHLCLSQYEIKSLPVSIGGLKYLEYLDLSANKLIYLPDSIGNLIFLKELDLSANNLAELPESISDLQSLEKLNLVWNHTIKLPSSICNLSSLKYLNFDMDHDQGAILSQSDEVLLFLAKKDTIPLYDVKNFISKGYIKGVVYMMRPYYVEDGVLDLQNLGIMNLVAIQGLDKLNNLKTLKFGGNQLSQELIDELGGLDLERNANNPQKFIEYCRKKKEKEIIPLKKHEFREEEYKEIYKIFKEISKSETIPVFEGFKRNLDKFIELTLDAYISGIGSKGEATLKWIEYIGSEELAYDYFKAVDRWNAYT